MEWDLNRTSKDKFRWMARDEKGSDDGLLTKLKLGTGELVYLLCKTVFFSLKYE
jgi:hypothetical protein